MRHRSPPHPWIQLLAKARTAAPKGTKWKKWKTPVFDRSRRGAVALMVSVNIREHSPPAIRDSVARKGHTKTARHHQFINFSSAEVNSGAAIVTFARRRFFADLDIEGEIQRSCV